MRQQARTDILGGASLRAYEMLRTEAAAVAALDPSLAALMYVDASCAAWTGGDPAASLDAAEGAKRLARGQRTEVRTSAELALGIALVMNGQTARGGRRVRAALADLPRGSVEADVLRLAGLSLMWVDDYPGARVVLDAAVEYERATSEPWLAAALDTLALADYRVGRWQQAEARSAEALRLADERGQTEASASCLTTLARIAASRGQEDACRAHVAAATALVKSDSMSRAYAATALALLDVGMDRPESAAERLEGLERFPMRDEPSLFDWRADLIEAYVRCGRTADAAVRLVAFERSAMESGRRSARALLARCRGLLAPSSGIDAEFDEALRLHVTLPLRFDMARTELSYGERLRRARRRADARPHLDSALRTFTELGAASWAERARRELVATQGRRRAGGTEALDRLTDHERRVANLVQRGARNREIANQLFVSERTVEYHLTNIYDKLKLRSRTELANLLATGKGT
jgi:ATP/maltotriose-dependent transcriptional regulator MalT